MGKKAKKKTTRSAQKEKQLSTTSSKNVSQKSIPTMTVDETSVIKDAIVCPHLKTSINLEKITSKLTSFESVKCDDCREVVGEKRSSKVKGKQGKKKGGNSSSETKAIWVCLDCGHFTCGGVGFPTTPHTHATRHAKQNHHPLAIQFANPNLRWCFSCDTLIPVQISENGEQKDSLFNIVKLLKTPQSSENTLDVEDVWFGTGSVINEIKLVNTQINSENNGVYTVKGLLNLGNTCFFNSILQNLLAMDKLRDHFLKLEGPVGPLTVSLKKLFVEFNQSTVAKNVVNPRSLFNSVCNMAPQFKGYQQQDSHELLRFLLDGLCNEESGRQNCAPKHSIPTFVDAVFGGQISSSVSCLECGHTSVVYEPYLDLSLPLPTKKTPSKKMPLVSRKKTVKPPLKRRGKFVIKNNKNDLSQMEKVTEKMSEISIKESCVSSDDVSSWLDYVEPSKTVSLTDDSWLDYSTNDQNMELQNNGNCDEVLWEDEPLLKVKESEVILLPYEELATTSNGDELASSSVSYEQESSEFDGFGGLFDEPEVVVSGQSQTLTRNESESDSDEVDNTDSPVSVDKCLAYFTTTEILTKTEHSWYCEQCSKALIEQKMKLKNKLHEHVTNGISNLYISSDSVIENSVSNGLQNDKNDCSRVAPELPETVNLVNGDVSCSDTACNEEGCTVQDTDAGKCNGEKIERRVSNRLAKKNGVNGVENDDVDSGSVKVARDASKRILINTVPPLLTIHLKRLSQDGRGRLSKLNGHIDFKDVMDLNPYMDPRCKDKGTYVYELIGVVEHIGTMRGGHYVAYVRGEGKWYHASDAQVRQVSLEEVMRCEAYILFYHKM